MCHDEKRDINGNEPYHFLTKICTKYTLFENRSIKNYISWDFFHFSSFIHNGDNLNMKENLRFHGEILRKLKI